MLLRVKWLGITLSVCKRFGSGYFTGSLARAFGGNSFGGETTESRGIADGVLPGVLIVAGRIGRANRGVCNCVRGAKFAVAGLYTNCGPF